MNAKLMTFVLALAAAMAGTGAASAGKVTMSLSGPSAPPIGHVQFCDVHPGQCRPFGEPERVVRLNGDTYEQLATLNTAVNRAVMPATDMEIFGTLERWEYPGLSGDCEDYVLEKRRLLVEGGWPESALLITVVRDEIGEGHAVLTVRTDRGDLVLDNKTDRILPWNETPYFFVKRQSARNAAAWDGIDDGRPMAVGSLR